MVGRLWDVYGMSMGLVVKWPGHVYGQMSICLRSDVCSINNRAELCLVVDGRKKSETKRVRPLYSRVFTVLRRFILMSVQLKEWICLKLASSFVDHRRWKAQMHAGPQNRSTILISNCFEKARSGSLVCVFPEWSLP